MDSDIDLDAATGLFSPHEGYTRFTRAWVLIRAGAVTDGFDGAGSAERAKAFWELLSKAHGDDPLVFEATARSALAMSALFDVSEWETFVEKALRSGRAVAKVLSAPPASREDFVSSYLSARISAIGEGLDETGAAGVSWKAWDVSSS